MATCQVLSCLRPACDYDPCVFEVFIATARTLPRETPPGSGDHGEGAVASAGVSYRMRITAPSPSRPSVRATLCEVSQRQLEAAWAAPFCKQDCMAVLQPGGMVAVEAVGGPYWASSFARTSACNRAHPSGSCARIRTSIRQSWSAQNAISTIAGCPTEVGAPPHRKVCSSRGCHQCPASAQTGLLAASARPNVKPATPAGNGARTRETVAPDAGTSRTRTHSDSLKLY